MTHPLNDRAQLLLKSLVERYIRDGQPVGSRILSKDSGLNLSPATIRNVMCDLEDMGFIRAPHTSAGRIPTVQGYRVFVDSLLTVKPLHSKEVEQYRAKLGSAVTKVELVEATSDLLSSITRMAGVVTIPRRKQTLLRQIEFVSLSDKRVLVILVLNDQEVQNRVIHTEKTFSAQELLYAANFLNSEFAGMELTTIRQRLLASMQQARNDMGEVMQTAMSLADQVLDDKQQEDFVLAGQTNLMNFADMANIDKLRQLFDAFNTKNDILHLLDQSISAEGIQIFIGEESGYRVLDECSIVTSSYKVNDDVVGVLGVIGPTRMAYDRVIPIVDVTARLLSAVLTSE